MCTAQGAAEDGALVAVVMSAVCCIPLGSFGVDAVNAVDAVDAHCYLMLLALLEAYIHATKPTSPVLKSLLRCAKFISGRAWNLLSLPFLGWVPVLPLKSPEFHWLKPCSVRGFVYFVCHCRQVARETFAGSILAALLLVALWDDSCRNVSCHVVVSMLYTNFLKTWLLAMRILHFSSSKFRQASIWNPQEPELNFPD